MDEGLGEYFDKIMNPLARSRIDRRNFVAFKAVFPDLKTPKS
jgi:hypothetical protein